MHSYTCLYMCMNVYVCIQRAIEMQKCVHDSAVPIHTQVFCHKTTDISEFPSQIFYFL